jgi:uncharacterized protein (DUF2252 family)
VTERVHRTVAERETLGREARKRAPRHAHGFDPRGRTIDPLAIIEQQNESRVPALVPVRHGRMGVNAFTYYRGAAAVMAADLARVPNTGLEVQLGGDAHVLNFGVFASPERRLLFDMNDFDETLRGPFEWDLKRLVASLVLACRERGFSESVAEKAVLEAIRSYRARVEEYTKLCEIEIWYARVAAEDLMAAMPRDEGKHWCQGHHHESTPGLFRFAEPWHGKLRIKTQAPLVRDLDGPETEALVRELVSDYRDTLWPSRRILLDRYQFVHGAHKVVGVGSVGTRCYVALMMGRDQNDPLFLQIKQALPSVLEAHLPKSEFQSHGERVVTGQRLTQAASDVFLGWVHGRDGCHYYVRQLRDWKASVEMDGVGAPALVDYGKVCAWALARGHARTGDVVSIDAYIGGGDHFERALLDFARGYADQTERDYEIFAQALASGRLSAFEGAEATS